VFLTFVLFFRKTEQRSKTKITTFSYISRFSEKQNKCQKPKWPLFPESRVFQKNRTKVILCIWFRKEQKHLPNGGHISDVFSIFSVFHKYVKYWNDRVFWVKSRNTKITSFSYISRFSEKQNKRQKPKLPVFPLFRVFQKNRTNTGKSGNFGFWRLFCFSEKREIQENW